MSEIKIYTDKNPKQVVIEVKQKLAKDGKSIDKKVNKIKELKAEANRLASLANKRIRRLEANGLQDAPAYQAYIAQGGKPFSTRGKDYNELQAELARLRNFINSETSTIRGVNNYLKEIANNTGIKYKNLTDLRNKASGFFELASKVEQYLRQVDDIASAIGYQKIWESINQYTAKHRIDLGSSKNDMERMIADITQALKEFDTPIVGAGSGIWYHLSKD